MNTRTFFALSFIFLFSLSFSPAFADTFNRNLRQGSRGLDVLDLQKVLNGNSSTQISLNGAGSPGLETTFFGSLTTKAVIRFQELYRDEILTPFGLLQGTGFVGQATRNKLNQITAVAQLSPEPANNDQNIVNVPVGVGLFGGQPYLLKAGADLTIKGLNFSPNGNTVYLNDMRFDNLSSTSSLDIYLKLPTTIADGKYKLRVVNANGDSDTLRKIPVYVEVRSTQTTSAAPVISSITPATVKFGDELSITGIGFDLSGNTVFSPFGSSTNLSSQNNVIKFNTSNLTVLQNFPAQAKAAAIRVPIFIINKAGMPSESSYVDVTF